MEIEVENIKFLDLIKEAKSVRDLEEIRVSLLGKKGEITNLLRSLGQMEAEERQIKSPQYNKLKHNITTIKNYITTI
jgi:phenylalanyl-tRNA synthetase alpha chain